MMKFFNLDLRAIFGITIDDLKSHKTIRDRAIRRFSIVYLGFLLSFILILFRLIIVSFDQPIYRIAKNIKTELTKAILANCPFNDLIIIYDKTEKVNIQKDFYFKRDIYEMSVDLGYILEDIIRDYYQQKSTNEIYISKLRLFAKEANEQRPFDKLDESQKELFIKLRNTAGDKYVVLKDDINSISDELYNKNEVINQYLGKSNQSYALAIIALLFTILQSIPIVKREVKDWLNRQSK